MRVESVSKRNQAGEIPVTALDAVTLAIEPASVVAVMGPSGSGKSTLLPVIGAMEAPDDRMIEVGDVEVTSLSAGHERTG